MRWVVKLGGRALDDRQLVAKAAAAVAVLAASGDSVAVVHGGGAALSRRLRELGRESRFVNGLRVTDAPTRDVALMVLAGQLNKQLAAAIGAAGQPAVGLCGGDLGLFRARPIAGQPDLGFVGEVCAVEPRWLAVLWQHGIVPVISSLALGSDGEYYNVNADHMASACAAACGADALVFLTDVPGVQGADGTVVTTLKTGTIQALADSAVISGGMLPKLTACRRALEQGVPCVRILPAARVELLPRFFQDPVPCGTEVVR